jgi:ribonuclease T1
MRVVASPSTRSPRPLAVLAAAVVLLLTAGALASRSGHGSQPAPKAGVSSVPTVHLADLPPQARHTLALIASGGPFPFAQDGVVFTNLEGLLPNEPTGYYHEYTVVTPGSADRGARRIIAGGRGEQYYTDDHYSSFLEVLP